MSGEDEGREERVGSHPLHRLVMKALVEKRGAERVPQLADALHLQLLLMMRLHCRDDRKFLCNTLDSFTKYKLLF